MPGHVFTTAIGTCSIEWSGINLTGFRLPEIEAASPPHLPTTDAPPAWVAGLVQRVRAHLAGELLQDFADVPYNFEQVASFQRAVLVATLSVKAGRTASYGELAAALGQPPGASRAIGIALGKNPWPLLVPCHRIVGAGGRMTGFSGPGGIKTKLRLLALEGAEMFAE